MEVFTPSATLPQDNLTTPLIQRNHSNGDYHHSDIDYYIVPPDLHHTTILQSASSLLYLHHHLTPLLPLSLPSPSTKLTKSRKIKKEEKKEEKKINSQQQPTNAQPHPSHQTSRCTAHNSRTRAIPAHGTSSSHTRSISRTVSGMSRYRRLLLCVVPVEKLEDGRGNCSR